MINTRCQICGKRKHLRKDGMIAHHCVGGPVCPGKGHPPIELTDEWLAELSRRTDAAYEAAGAAIKALEDARANYIDPALITRRGLLAGQSLKLWRRLRRHRGWAARYVKSYDRQMMEQGCCWADKPPPYLISRYVGEIGWTPDAFR
jgi:hypothetical protein